MVPLLIPRSVIRSLIFAGMIGINYKVRNYKVRNYEMTIKFFIFSFELLSGAVASETVTLRNPLK